MVSVAAREIKRRGIGAVDEGLVEGPVQVIKNDRPSYVVLTIEQYNELVEAQEEATIARVKASLEDVAAGRVREVTVEELTEEMNRP